MRIRFLAPSAVLLAFCLGVCSQASGQNGIITTVAGNGTAGFSGDGGPAISASLNGPGGVAVDSFGDIFIGDFNNYRVRMVSASVITTVAGNGTAGFSGDGGPATASSLYPAGVAVDTSGNLFIADVANNRIRKVSAGGVITTVAGNGVFGFSGDGGPATSASFRFPYSVAVDASGDIFIADNGNNRIRRVSAASGVVTTVAGSGTQGFSGDNGPATSASLDNPDFIALDSSGNLFIGDTTNYRIRRVSASGTITTVAGNGTPGYSGDGGPATSASLYNSGGIAVDTSGNLFIADTGNLRVRKVSASGVITTVAGDGAAGFSGDGGPATSASLNGPARVAVDASGNLFIADQGNNRIREVSAAASGPSQCGIDTYLLRLYNIDDTFQALLTNSLYNAYPILKGTYEQDTGFVNITSFLQPGTNNLELSLMNLGGGYTYGYQLEKDGSIIDQNSCGTAGSVGCNNGDTTTGVVYTHQITIQCSGTASLVITTSSLPNGVLNQPYGPVTLAASGGTGSYTSWFITASLPPGLSLNASTGFISGTPTAAGTYNFSVSVRDSSGAQSLPQSLSIAVGTGGGTGSGGGGSSITASPPSVSFTAVSSRQSLSNLVTVVSTSGSVPFTVVYATTSGGNWLSGPSSGIATPSGDSLTVTANSGSLLLSGSPYMGTVTISITGTTWAQTRERSRRDGTGGGTSVTLPITLTLVGKTLVASPNLISISVPAGQKSVLQMQASTVTPMGFTATLVPADKFLLLSPASGMLTLPEAFGVGVDATLLSPGSYTSSIMVQCATCFDTFVAVAATVTAPAGPAITSINLSSATAGNPSEFITITGSGFVSGAGVQWNGLSLSTTFVSATTLAAQIPASDLLNPGTGQITVENPSGQGSNSFPFLVSSASALQFVPVAPCRVLDTRLPPTSPYPANSTFGSPYIPAGTVRTIPIPASTTCPVPANAAAWSLNFTVQPRTTTVGYLTAWPTGTALPNVSTLSFSNPAVVLAAAGIVPAGAGGAINATATQDVDLIVDINGYFVPPGAGTLQFYPLPPCRVLDTRTPANGGTFPANTTFGSPSLDGVHARSFPIPSSNCGAPASAAAFSFNVGVVPQGALYFLAAYPTGGTLPVVSTMNSFDGTILANAAIVPAGPGGAVNFFASNPTDFFVDINGYFAPPGPGGLNFYTVSPCRLVDTRNANGTFGGPTFVST